VVRAVGPFVRHFGLVDGTLSLAPDTEMRHDPRRICHNLGFGSAFNG
jgi:hypothetical protein